ncbi:dihydrodipicolinate synthase family protein [Stenotrophomonas maltophilia]|uniref:dihydrodipicolinate synthase family protein n=1 Tax=Stenotrophomonas maltophilia TaxID=40324 RepID=UPI0038768C11
MRVLREALSHSGAVPVIVGIGALRTRDVLALARDAEDAGAAGLLLAPVSYQPLKEHEVYTLFESVCMAVAIGRHANQPCRYRESASIPPTGEPRRCWPGRSHWPPSRRSLRRA